MLLKRAGSSGFDSEVVLVLAEERARCKKALPRRLTTENFVRYGLTIF